MALHLLRSSAIEVAEFEARSLCAPTPGLVRDDATGAMVRDQPRWPDDVSVKIRLRARPWADDHELLQLTIYKHPTEH